MAVAKPYRTNENLCGDDIFDLVYSVPSGERYKSKFTISTVVEQRVRQLRDGLGRYLYTNNSLVGYPVAWDNNPNLPTTRAIRFGVDAELGVSAKSDSCAYCSRRPDPKYSYCPGCGAPR